MQIHQIFSPSQVHMCILLLSIYLVLNPDLSQVEMGNDVLFVQKHEISVPLSFKIKITLLPTCLVAGTYEMKAQNDFTLEIYHFSHGIIC